MEPGFGGVNSQRHNASQPGVGSGSGRITSWTSHDCLAFLSFTGLPNERRVRLHCRYYQVANGNDLEFSPKTLIRSLGRVTVKLPPMARTRGFSRSVAVFFDMLNRIIHTPAHISVS